MKVRKYGVKIVFTPYAELYHYESKSRGLEDTPEKVARFNKEIATFEKKWPEILKNGDPYYNPNLTSEEPGLFSEKNHEDEIDYKMNVERIIMLKKKKEIKENNQNQAKQIQAN